MINQNSRIGQGRLRKEPPHTRKDQKERIVKRRLKKRKRRRKIRTRSFLIIAKMIVKTVKSTTISVTTKISPTIKIISTRTTQTLASNKSKIRTKKTTKINPLLSRTISKK